MGWKVFPYPPPSDPRNSTLQHFISPCNRSHQQMSLPCLIVTARQKRHKHYCMLIYKPKFLKQEAAQSNLPVLSEAMEVYSSVAPAPSTQGTRCQLPSIGQPPSMDGSGVQWVQLLQKTEGERRAATPIAAIYLCPHPFFLCTGEKHGVLFSKVCLVLP